VDMVVPRHELRPTLSKLCRILTKAPVAPPAPSSVVAVLPQGDEFTPANA
jgi:acetyl-CoA carboxylase carboxyl transferase subunit beta